MFQIILDLGTHSQFKHKNYILNSSAISEQKKGNIDR